MTRATTKAADAQAASQYPSDAANSPRQNAPMSKCRRQRRHHQHQGLERQHEDDAGEPLLERQSPAAKVPKDQRSAGPGRAINGKNHSIQRRHYVPDHRNIRR